MSRRIFNIASALSLALCLASGSEWWRSYHSLDFGARNMDGRTFEWLSNNGRLAIVTMAGFQDQRRYAVNSFPLRERDAGYVLAFGATDRKQIIHDLRYAPISLTREARRAEALCLVDQILQRDPDDDYGRGVEPLLEDKWRFRRERRGGAPLPQTSQILESPSDWPVDPARLPPPPPLPPDEPADFSYLNQLRIPDPHWPGFRFVTEDAPNFHGSGIVIPLVIPLAAFALLPACFAYSWCHRKRRLRNGVCPACGYDLRASPDRCPECGAAVAGNQNDE